MENFVLYEELGKGDHSLLYKGRRKGTITFVAIHCIDKCKRPETTNLVRLMYEIEHPNIVKFHEWYETTNHLWLVVELCTGGSLENVINQDEHLPESTIRTFGIDVVKGLHHIHSLGIVISDLRPAKIQLDGQGVLKFADFGLARMEGEDLAQLFTQFADAGDTWTSTDQAESADADKEIPKEFRCIGSPSYLAPEVLQGAAHSMASDLWSLGVMLYVMYTGQKPFIGDDVEQIVNGVLHQDFQPMRVKSSRAASKTSTEFQDLIESLLKKNPDERLGWGGLVTHPFWQGGLQQLAHELEGAAIPSSDLLRESFRKSVARFSVRDSMAMQQMSVKGSIDYSTATAEQRVAENDSLFVDQTDYGGEKRPRTAPGTADGNVNFTISSRPQTALTLPNDEHLSTTSPHKTMTIQNPTAMTIGWSADVLYADGEEGDDVKKLVYHSSDFTITPVVDNPKIQKVENLKYDAKVIPVPPFTVERLATLSIKDIEKHVTSLVTSLDTYDKGPPSPKRLHLLNYAGSLAVNHQVANLFIRYGGLASLVKQLNESQHVDLRCRLSRVIALMCHHASDVEESTELGEAISSLSDLLRDQFRNTRVKLALLPAVGELLCLIASQEQLKGHVVDKWTVPTNLSLLLIRSLREGEDAVVNHTAAKIIENVASASAFHAMKFATSEVAQLLWNLYTHATQDAIRITSLVTLSRLCKQSVSIFQAIIEKVGMPKILSSLSIPITKIQQAVITMFAALASSDVKSVKFAQDKDFIFVVMKLLESPSVIIRGKVFLLLLEIARNNQDLLPTCCHNRLIMYIERDSRAQAPGRIDSASHAEYLAACLNLLVNFLISLVPRIMSDTLQVLDTVTGRKHPSTLQAKQLKAVLPLIVVVQHLGSSQIFRPRIISETFVRNVGLLLDHVKSIDVGVTQLQLSTSSFSSDEFTHSLFAVIESLVQHPVVLSEHISLIVDKLLPPLAALVASSIPDTRSISLRLFSEIAVTYLNQVQCGDTEHLGEIQQLQDISLRFLLPHYEQLLLEPDPLPSYTLKLIVSLLENSAALIGEFEKAGLVPVLFQVLSDHRNNPTGATMQQVASILTVLILQREANIHELYSHGIVNHLTSLISEIISTQVNFEGNADQKAISGILMSLLDALHGILKYVSEVVRKALQMKKAGGDISRQAEQAEALLITNKPFTDLLGPLPLLLTLEDTDVSDLALKSLSLLVQLFGGENVSALTTVNLPYYTEALKKADAKKQKILLRILKRVLSTERTHVDLLLQQGSELIDTVQALTHTASSHAEVALSTLAVDVLKTVKIKN